ncbi:MAG TPA: mechanosensitive ion channel domain-containing protein, partial [Allocoleopsis sp.]
LFSFSHLVRAIGIFSLSFILCILLGIAPAIAQGEAHAPVVIDGNELFQVGNSGGFAAEQRAEGINQELREATQTNEEPQVEVGGSTDLPTILLNGKHLLTVTEQDTLPGRTKAEQAAIWADYLETALEQAQYGRTMPYLRSAVFQTIVTLALALLLHLALGRFWKRKLSPELRAVTLIPDPDTAAVPQQASLDLLLGVLLAIVRLGIWLTALFYVTSLFPRSRQWSYRLTEIVINSFTAPLFTLGDNQYSVLHLLTLAVLLFALEICTKTVTNVVKTRILHLTVANRGTREVIAVVIRYTLLFLGALVLLQIWGIDLSSLALLASALGIGIGLGLQDIAKDIGSGLVLLFERPVQVGDFVQVGEFEGTIEAIGSRSTVIRTLDHISIIVPNSRVLSGEIINWSHHNPVSRLHLPVGVAYGCDVEQVRSALLEAAQEHVKVLSSPKPQVFFKGFGNNSLDLDLLVWTAEPSKHVVIKSELYFAIEAKFRQSQIEVPFPQRDLHIRTGNLPIDFSPEAQQTLQQLWQRSPNGKKE